MAALLAMSPILARAQAGPSLAEVLASADQAWTAGKYDAALDRYQTVLRRDSTSARATYRVATMLAWRNDLNGSASLFRVYLRLAPGDDDGRVGLARTLAWGGRYDEAMALCDSILAGNANHRDAALLAAQVLAWRGNLPGAITRYQQWLGTHPKDADAWTGLARTWQWAARPDEARVALLRAIDADPSNATARVQLEWANVALAPSLEPTISSTDDSDDNRSTTYSMRGGWAAPWSARLLADASYREADLSTLHGTSTTLRATSSWTPLAGQWTVRGELGAARLDAVDGAAGPHAVHLEPVAAARLSGRLTTTLSVGGGVSHAAFDETAALIRSGIGMTSVDGDADLTIRPRLTLGGGGSWSRLSGGSGPNSRVAGSTTLRWSLARFVSLAAGVRGFGYQHAAFDGYFAPKRYLLAETSARFRAGADLGWALESEIGLGDQAITAFDASPASRFAQRVSGSLLYRPAPGLEWGLTGGYANVASPTTIRSADYRAYTVALRGRVRL